MSNKEAQRPAPQEQNAATVPASPAVPPLDLHVAKLTDVGRLRPHNEDYVDYFVPPDPHQRKLKGDIFLIADGMGGHQAGEVASRSAVEIVITQYYGDTTSDIGASLVRAVRAANQQVYGQAQADPAKAGMGTTLVAAVVQGRKVYLANVGDSRAYVINKLGISQITQDHSWVEEQVRAGLLSPEQASRHPQRNLLTRALGSKPSVEVDLFEGELQEGDMLLLCTDGLTGRVEDAEIAAIVQDHTLDEATRLLVAQANERGGNDNISVLIVGGGRESLAAAASKPAAAGKKAVRPSPLIPILGGTAGLLVLAILAFLLVPVLLGDKATPTVTLTLSPSLPTATVLSTGELTPTAQVTVTPSATMPVEPTATLAATFTPAVSTTTPGVTDLSPLPTPGTTSPSPSTDTPSPSPTGTGLSSPAPVLQEPPTGEPLQGVTTFTWSYSQSLPLNGQYQVLIWKEDQAQHDDAGAPTASTSQDIDLAQVPQVRDGGAGQYFWSVVVVDTQTGQHVSPESVPRRFVYAGTQ
jgi:serine/threonine protein phosphatase PrpC